MGWIRFWRSCCCLAWARSLPAADGPCCECRAQAPPASSAQHPDTSARTLFHPTPQGNRLTLKPTACLVPLVLLAFEFPCSCRRPRFTPHHQGVLLALKDISKISVHSQGRLFPTQASPVSSLPCPGAAPAWPGCPPAGQRKHPARWKLYLLISK